MTLPSPARGQPILHTHITAFSNLLGGVADAGEDIRLTQRTNASDYANVLGNVDTTNGYALKVVYGTSGSPTTLMTVSKATGTKVFSGALTTPALTAQNTVSGGTIAVFQNSASTNIFTITPAGMYNLAANGASGQGAAIALGSSGVGSRFSTLTTFTAADAAAIGSASFVNISSNLVVQTAGDNAAVNGHITLSGAGTGSVKGCDFQAYRAVGTPSGSSVCWGAEIGSHPGVTSTLNDQLDYNVGIYIHSASSRAGNVGTIPLDAGIVITGEDGYGDYVRFRAANASYTGAIVFRVAGGTMTIGGVGDQDGDVVSAARWRGGAGTASLPGIAFNSDLNNGLYLSAADQVSMATNGTQRTIWAAGGSVRAAGSALLTTATDGYLHIPFCAGAPTGVPTNIGGVALVFDATNNRLYVYDSGWLSVTLA